MTRRTGVFVCHCGNNIAATVDVKRVAEELSGDDGVVFSKDYVYMCSDPGQQAVINAVKDNNLDSMVISCCSPTLHEKTFRDCSALGGLNEFQCEIANIREQCAWVHADKAEGTEKALKITRNAVARARRTEALTPIGVPVTRRVMVVGGGIAGIQASLDLANAGLQVILVEKQPTIGGNMLQLSETFPTLDCSQCILSPKMVEVSKNPKITLMTQSEVRNVSGFVGNFKVKVHTKATYVDPEKCKICDDCAKVCPTVRHQRVRSRPDRAPRHLHPLRPGNSRQLHPRRGQLPRPQPGGVRQVRRRLRGRGHRLRRQAQGHRAGGRRHRRRHRLRPLRQGQARRVRRRQATPTCSTACSSSGCARPRAPPAAR